MRFWRFFIATTLAFAIAFCLASCGEGEHTHAFGEWQTVKEATCSEPGEAVRVCECAQRDSKEIPIIPHTQVTVEAVAPTCTEVGLTEGQRCSVCSAVTVAQTEVAAKGHSWDNGVITKAPSPDGDGEKTFTCSVCKESRVEAVEYAPSEDIGEMTSDKWKSIFERFLSAKNGVMSASFAIDGQSRFVTYKSGGDNLHISRGFVGSNPNSNVYTTSRFGVDYRFDFVGGKWVLGEDDRTRPYVPYAFSPLTLEKWRTVSESFASFTYNAETDVYFSESHLFDFTYEGKNYRVGKLSFEIKNGAIVGCSYELTSGESSFMVDSDFSELGSTSVYLPYIHSEHNYTVFDEENILYRCSDCLSFSYPYYRAEYVGGVYLIGERVSKSDFNVFAYFENGREFPITDFIIEDALLNYSGKGITILDKNSDYLTYVITPAFDEDFVYTDFTDDGLVYLEENGAATIVGYIRSKADVVIPEEIDGLEVVKIADSTFGSAYQFLKSIKISSTVTELGDALESCYNLKTIEVDGANTVYKSIDGNLYTKDGKVLLKYSPARTNESFSLPVGVERISDLAFQNCRNLSYLTLPDGLLEIGHQAMFSSWIIEVNIPASVCLVEMKAFDNTEKLERITVDPDNPYYKDVDGNLYTKDGTTLIQYAVGKSATSFTVPDGVKVIGDSAFSYAPNLVTVTISEQVSYVGDDAFRCPYFDVSDASIKRIVFMETEGWTYWGDPFDVSDPESNAEFLLGEPFYPLIRATDEPEFPGGENPGGGEPGGGENPGGDNPGGDNPGGNNPGGAENEDDHVSYSEFQAEFYAKKFSQYTDSVARDFYISIINDEKLVRSIAAWEGMHLAVDSDYETGKMREKDLYKMVIFDLLTGNGTDFVSPMDLLYGEEERLVLEAAEGLLGTKWLDKEAKDAIRKLAPKQMEEMLKFDESFKFLGSVEFVWDAFNNGLEALEAVIRYKVISNMSEGYRNVLEQIGNDYTNGEQLRIAALECVDYFDRASDELMDSILANEYWGRTLDYIFEKLVDDVWSLMAKHLFPGVTAVQFAAKGTVILCDSIFKLDKFNKAFYELRVAVIFEDSIRKILADNDFDYTDDLERENYLYAVELFQKSALLGMRYSINLLEAKLEDPLVFGSDRLLAEETVQRIGERHDGLIYIYQSFERNCVGMYELYLESEFDGVSPVEATAIYCISGEYRGQYTASGSSSEAMLLVMAKSDFLGNYSMLSSILNYVNQCSADAGGGNLYTYDSLTELIRRQEGDFIAIFARVSDINCPNKNDVVYTMSVSYVEENKFDFKAETFIWQGGAQMVDLLGVTCEPGKVKGYAYDTSGNKPVKVGEIDLSL